MTRFNALYTWSPVVIYCAAIFIQSSYPSMGGDMGLPHGDKLLHFSGYVLLGMLMFRAFSRQWPGVPLNRLLFLSAFCAALYAVSDEIHQHFNPYRDGDPGDVLADMLGGMCGAALCAVCHASPACRVWKNPALTKLTLLYRNSWIKYRQDG